MRSPIPSYLLTRAVLSEVSDVHRMRRLDSRQGFATPRSPLSGMVERLGADGDYQSLQQFLADSPWDPAVVVRAVGERVVPAIEVEA